MKIAQYPTSDQITELLQGSMEGPVVMLNLLSFKKFAESAEGEIKEDLAGEDSYAKYGEKMIKFVESNGGRFIWSGRVDSMVIGESDEQFDMVALVEYPSRKAFIEITSSDHVREIGKDRSAGLAGQWLIAMTEASIGE